MKIYYNILTVFIILNVSLVIAQSNQQVNLYGEDEKVCANEIVYFKGDSIISKINYDLFEEKDYIVVFSEPSMSEYSNLLKSDGRKIINTSELQSQEIRIDNIHSKFALDLRLIEERSKSNSLKSSIYKNYSFTHKFKYAINGIALKTTKEIINEIGKLSYIKGVYDDYEIKLKNFGSQNSNTKNIPVNTTEYTGDGVTIAIIDTGIDYLHPDLGGGFGPEFKVIGGYDFINNDNDPMDDNGHGTSVAGIIAANGQTFSGTAKNAKLLAYKVLNDIGYGSSSYVIAAIDLCLNLNMNSDANDDVDLINLSLGFIMGGPFDPDALAVDNASQSGIICVVAAGNDGGILGYNSIGSPATSVQAISVGAADANNNIALFSSKGPSRSNYGIKPEIVAIGSDVYTTNLGIGYHVVSGTSIAAPHVTGISALLVEKNSDWTPKIIKGILMNSTDDLDEDVWTQGNGLVNMDKAIEQNTLITPATINLGLVNTSTTIYKTILIHNYSQELIHYQFDSNIPLGINVTFSPSTVDINTNEVIEIELTFEIYESLEYINVNMIDWLPYSGDILAYSSNDTLKVPFSFLKSHFLNIEIEKNANENFFFVHDNAEFSFFNDRGYTRNEYGDGYTLLLNEGVYDAIGHHYVQMGGENVMGIVTSENIDTRTVNSVDLSLNNLEYEYDPKPKDPASNLLNLEGETTIINYTNLDTEFGFLTPYNPFEKLYFNKIPSTYRFDWYTISNMNEKPLYHFKGSLSNLEENGELEILPTNYKLVDISYRVPDNINNIWMLEWYGHVSHLIAGWNPNEEMMDNPFQTEAFIMKDPSDLFPRKAIAGLFAEVFLPETQNNPDPFSSVLLYLLPWYKVNENLEIETYHLGEKSRNLLTIKGDNILYGLGPSHLWGKFDNVANFIRLKTNSDVGYAWEYKNNGELTNFFPVILNQFQDISAFIVEFTLKNDNDNVILQGNLTDYYFFSQNDGLWDKYCQINLPTPGIYSLQINAPSPDIQYMQGIVNINVTMDTRLSDPNPPNMTSFNIAVGNEFTDLIGIYQQGRIQFEVGDDSGVTNSQLFYKGINQNDWVETTLEIDDGLYHASIDETYPKDYISLKLIVTDPSGNELEYLAEPAFLNLGQAFFPDVVDLVSPADNSVDVSTELIINWNADSKSDKYELQIASDTSFVQIVYQDSLLVDTLIVTDALESNKTYFCRVRGINMFGKGEWSQVHKFTTVFQLPEFVSLVFPANNYENLSDSLEFKWNSGGAKIINYWFELSEDSLFSSSLIDSTLSDTVKSVTDFELGFYWWRVKSKNNSGWGEFSEVRKIISNITGIDNELVIPAEYKLSNNYPNPFNPSTTISYSLPEGTYVDLRVYNILGEEVVILVNKEQDAGHYRLIFNAAGLSSGIYLYKIKTDNYYASKKMIYLK